MTTIRIGEPLPDALLACELSRSDGKTTRFGELVRAEPTLFVFVRQFACAGCSERTSELLVHLSALETSGVSSVVVGCGSVEQARAFEQRFALSSRPIAVVTDPTLAVQRTAGLLRSHWGVLGARATFNLLRAMTHGHPNGWSGGDFYQLGGTLLLDERGRVVLSHVERHLGETFPIGDVVDQTLTLLARRKTGGSTFIP